MSAMLAVILILGISVVMIIIIYNAERMERWIQRRNKAKLDAWLASREADSVGDTFPAEWCDHDHA